MDVLRPPVVYIGNRCYRKNVIVSKALDNAEQYEDDEPSFRPFPDDYADESCSAGVDSDIVSSGTGFELVVQLPSVYFKYIIGKKGETKKRIEQETETQIKIPRQHEEGDIVIKGRNRCGVSSARTRIDVLVSSARRRLPFTHFLSLPVVSDGVLTKFDEFKQAILESCGQDRGIDGTIFQNRYKLHLTIGTLVLMNDYEVEEAANLLHECQQELVKSVLRDEPLVARVSGLEYMNDDPNEVDVLYAKVSLKGKSNRLQMFVDRIVDRFVSAGIMNHEYDHVKLHITVMNSLMRKDPSGTTVPQSDRQTSYGPTKERESFDATNVLKLFGNYDFGDHHLNAIHISQRYSTAPDSYYASVATIQLP